MEWSYGVTTCAQRMDTLLPRTLASLAAAGFDDPRLFIDGLAHPMSWDSPFNALRMTCRQPAIGAYGNWLLAAWELYARRPQAQRYALFQDDVVLCLGVRQYLETAIYPDRGYLNLFTFATNEAVIFNKRGWCRSDQLGKGAVALVFDHMAMVTLLGQTHMSNKLQLPGGHKSIDGAVQHALVAQAGFTEYVHSPSLAQHVGREGTLGNHRHPDARTFPGEGWDAASGMHR